MQIHSHVKPVEDGQVGFSHAHQNYQLFTFLVLSSFLNTFFYFFHQAELPAVESLQVVQSLLSTAGGDDDDDDIDDDDNDDDNDDDDDGSAKSPYYWRSREHTYDFSCKAG